MIGCLPKQLIINGTDRAIRSDFRVALLIFQANGDTELSDREKTIVMLASLYENINEIPQEDIQEAIEKASWYLDGGPSCENSKQQHTKKVVDWEQDEQLIFSSVNKVAGREVRDLDYLHWWTFLGYFKEIGEGLFSAVINIRQKLNKHKKLEKYEQEFYKDNKALIDLKEKLTPEEQAEKEYFEKLLG